MGKQIAAAKGDEKQALLDRTKTLSAEVKQAEAAQGAADEAYRTCVLAIPNPAAEQAPAGGEDDFVVLEEVGTPRQFDFEPRDHVELGRLLGAIDLDRGAKVSGSRFYYLTGVGADLEFALVNMAMDQARAHGFTTVVPPALVKPRAMEGTGFLGQAADDVYRIEGEDMYLVGTSEVPLAAYHSDEILDADRLPRRYAAFSPCYRKEAGSHGKDTRGIIRVHWFDKVEMFTYTTVEESYREHERLLGWEKEFLDKLELAYRVIDVAAGRPRALRGAEVRLRGLDPDAGPLPRAHLHLELHRLPGAAPRHPHPGRGRAAGRWRPSTARCARSRAPSSRSSRPTSRRTAPCSSPRPCGPTCRAARC